MADYSSALYTAQLAAITNLAAAPNLRDYGGNVQYVHAKVTLPSTASAAELLNICYLPTTARVIPALCTVQPSVDPGACTLDIGISTNPDAYADGIDIGASAAAAPVRFDTNLCAQALTPNKLTDETLVYATVATETITTESVLTFHIAYTLG